MANGQIRRRIMAGPELYWYVFHTPLYCQVKKPDDDSTGAELSIICLLSLNISQSLYALKYPPPPNLPTPRPQAPFATPTNSASPATRRKLGGLSPHVRTSDLSLLATVLMQRCGCACADRHLLNPKNPSPNRFLPLMPHPQFHHLLVC